MMHKIIILIAAIVPNILFASSAGAAAQESDRKQAVAQIAPVPAITEAVKAAIPQMLPELARIISSYARYAPLIFRNNLPKDWAAVESDATMEIRYGGAPKRLLPGQSIDLSADPNFVGCISVYNGVEYAQFEITYPGPKNSVANQVVRLSCSLAGLDPNDDKGREYILALNEKGLPSLAIRPVVAPSGHSIQ